ncbi:hypothetical protein AeMF1_003694 [Aphanomyces euteiches]|nr:hypothetical protein AeMF1_003694 [Aphanomyces euteiches]
MKTSVVAIFAATAHGNGISLPSCGHWTPTYPRNQEYNNSASISTEKLNVHLIAHTHDDPGWLRTVDQYYTERVDYILDTVVTELAKNPNRRFMYVEQSFFQRWWREQSEETKHLVKKLVKSGQLDLTANGGWVMHDEATPHYTTMLDQTTFGHKFLLKEFGVRPRIGWQIDPFGHSSTQGLLLSVGIGFDGLYFARMDYQDYDKRLREKNLEFLWKASPSRNETVFTGNHIFWPMGSDMEYINTLRWFKNLDKLIHYGNQEGRVNILYSTLGEYTDLILQDKSIEWAVKTDDFFPYANSQNTYWSGYFTSRPALKRYTRVANSLLQSIRHLEVWTKQKFSNVNHLAASVGLVLHHDSLSGTEKQVVADDYTERLAEGVTQGHLRLREILSSASLDLCLLANVSICNATNTLNPFTFIVYNPLPFAATFNVNLPIASSSAKVERSNGTTVSSAVLSAVPVYSKPLAHSAANELIVESLVPPLSWETFHVTPRNAPEHAPAPLSSDAVVFENEFLRARVNSVSGSLESLTDKQSNTTIQVTEHLLGLTSFIQIHQKFILCHPFQLMNAYKHL